MIPSVFCVGEKVKLTETNKDEKKPETATPTTMGGRKKVVWEKVFLPVPRSASRVKVVLDVHMPTNVL